MFTVALRWNIQEPGLCGACIEVKVTTACFDLRFSTCASTCSVSRAKATGRNTGKFSLYKLWSWRPSFSELSTKWQRIVAVANVSSLAKIGAHPPAQPESDTMATKKTENPVNACRKRTKTSCSISRRLSSETSFFKYSMLKVCITAHCFVTFTVFKNKNLNIPLSRERSGLVLASSTHSFFCFNSSSVCAICLE